MTPNDRTTLYGTIAVVAGSIATSPDMFPAAIIVLAKPTALIFGAIFAFYTRGIRVPSDPLAPGASGGAPSQASSAQGWPNAPTAGLIIDNRNVPTVPDTNSKEKNP